MAHERPNGEQGVPPVGRRALARGVKLKRGASVPWNDEVDGVGRYLDRKDDGVSVTPVYVDRLGQPQ